MVLPLHFCSRKSEFSFFIFDDSVNRNTHSCKISFEYKSKRFLYPTSWSSRSVGSTTSPWCWCSPTAASIHSSTLQSTTSFSRVSGVWLEKSRENRSLKSSPSPRAKLSRPNHSTTDVFRFSYVIRVTLYRRIFVLQHPVAFQCLINIGGHFGAKKKSRWKLSRAGWDSCDFKARTGKYIAVFGHCIHSFIHLFIYSLYEYHYNVISLLQGTCKFYGGLTLSSFCLAPRLLNLQNFRQFTISLYTPSPLHFNYNVFQFCIVV